MELIHENNSTVTYIANYCYGIEVLVTGITQNDPSWNVEAELRFWVNQVSDRDVIVSNVTGRIKKELAKEKTITVPPRRRLGEMSRQFIDS